MSGAAILQPFGLDAPARRAVLMVNPYAGGVRRAAVQQVVHHLGLDAAAILEIGRDGSAKDLAARAVQDGIPLLLVAGGDGTQHQAIQALAGSGTALGVLPLGTSNDLARRLGLATTLERSLAETETAKISAIDLIRMGRDWVATVGGLGLPAHVAQACNRLKARPRLRQPARALGKTIYTLAAAHRILCHGPQPVTCHIGLGGQDPTKWHMSAILVGTVDRFGGGLELVPASQLRGGTFAALLVTAATRPAILNTLLRVRAGRPLGRQARRFAHLTHFTFHADRLVGAFGDGEWLGLRHRMVIRLVPDALQVLVPGSAPLARPAVRLGQAV
jgi:diacylglycerol kinase (ATP)